MLHSVDARVLRLYTAVAHAVQRRTGRTCYWLAQQCAALVAASIMAVHVVDPSTRMLSDYLAAAFCAALAFIAHIYDRRFADDPSALLKPVADMPTRLVMVFLSAVITAGAVLAICMHHMTPAKMLIATITWSTMSCYYFMAVAPLPPARQRDRVRGTLIPNPTET